MTDHFLDGHKISPRLFSIGGRLAPISIRDQMVRGQMFVERLVEQGSPWHTPTHPLLIVGAGAAGVAAALTAVERYRIPTILADRLNTPFFPQAGAPTRWLDPTLYDFPADHWAMSTFPPRPTNYTPVQWSANWSHQLAVLWLWRLRVALHDNSQIFSFRPYTTLAAMPQLDPSGDFVRCEMHTTAPDTDTVLVEQIDCAVALLAMGPGKEKTYIRERGQPPHPTRGFGFWEQDPYREQNLLPDAPGVRPKIVITGSGDGAMQDFLRLTMRGNCPKEILRNLDIKDLPLQRLFSAEYRAQRVIHWGMGPQHEHAELQALHEVHTSVVTTLLEEDKKLSGALHEAIEAELRDPDPDIHLMYGCKHFGNCYGINRFLTLLVAIYLEQKLKRPILLPCKRAVDIQPLSDGHACAGSAIDCHGQMHRITWQSTIDCRNSKGPDTGCLDANVLVLRHGIDFEDVKIDATPNSHTRHILPCFLL
jgi:hypothetical protein